MEQYLNEEEVKDKSSRRVPRINVTINNGADIEEDKTIPLSEEEANVVDNFNDILDETLLESKMDWSDLIALKNKALETLIHYGEIVAKLLNEKFITDNLSATGRVSLSNVTGIFVKDGETFKNRISTIYSKHKEYKGKLTKFEEFGLYNMLFTEYDEATNNYITLNSSTIPTILTIVGEVDTALRQQLNPGKQIPVSPMIKAAKEIRKKATIKKTSSTKSKRKKPTKSK